MAFLTVVLTTLIEQELICLWGLWSCHFQNSSSEVCILSK